MRPQMNSKLCHRCAKMVPHGGAFEYFYRDRSQKDGRAFYCKDCEKARRAAANAGPSL